MKPFENLKARAGVGAPPKPDDTFETLGGGEGPPGSTLSEEERDRRAGRINQKNMRLSEWAKARLKFLKKAERATYGELIEAMIAAYEAAGAGLKPEQVPVDDARAGRLRKIEFWATEGFYKSLSRVAAERGMSISELQVEWLAREISRLDPQDSGRFGVRARRG